MAKVNWNSVIDNLQAALVWFVIGIIALCVMTLILFDVLAGTGVMWSLTSQNLLASVVISLATTGLLLALMFMGYSLQRTEYKQVGWGLFVVSMGVYLIDTYFDAMGADILRYGMIMGEDQIDNIHIMYRVLIGGISTVGEPLATAIIIGMPVLKEIIGKAIPLSHQYYRATTTTPQDLVKINNRVNSVVSTSPTPRTVPLSIPKKGPTYHQVNRMSDSNSFEGGSEE